MPTIHLDPNCSCFHFDSLFFNLRSVLRVLLCYYDATLYYDVPFVCGLHWSCMYKSISKLIRHWCQNVSVQANASWNKIFWLSGTRENRKTALRSTFRSWSREVRFLSSRWRRSPAWVLLIERICYWQQPLKENHWFNRGCSGQLCCRVIKRQSILNLETGLTCSACDNCCSSRVFDDSLRW